MAIATLVPAVDRRARVGSIDVIRGAVMVLMAIDHVRVFSGVPAGGQSPGVFFTRWVTHFCAPAFIFLAGTGAFLYGYRRTHLPRFLLTRGAWLVFLELTYFRVAWTFNFHFMEYELAGVIWVIGWCMILMSGLVRFSIRTIAVVGIVIIAGHNLLDSFAANLTQTLGQDITSNLWRIFYIGFWAGPVTLGPDGPNLVVLYSLVPWIGVMAAGYAFGQIAVENRVHRDRACLWIGLSALGAFLVLRGFNLYGDPHPWSGTALSFLNTTKYPASLDFLLMTLGPTIALIPALDSATGPIARALAVFGRVPFFYYALHIPLIHVLAIVVSLIREGSINAWLFTNHPAGSPPPPEGYMWSLGLLYMVWAIAVAILYVACRWFADLKARRTDWWLTYL
jgi:Predicted membrane protein